VNGEVGRRKKDWDERQRMRNSGRLGLGTKDEEQGEGERGIYRHEGRAIRAKNGELETKNEKQRG